MPAIIAAIGNDSGITNSGAAGVRKKGTETAVQLTDSWRLGGCTMAFTATLAAKLVERGLLQWDSTTADVFPEAADAFHPDCRTITLRQLLAHYSGLKNSLDWQREINTANPVDQQRWKATRLGLAEKPQWTPGSSWQYSPLGYVIVGAMIERVMHMTWEQAVRNEIFLPLGMRDSGFTLPAADGKLNQPWGHDAQGNPIVPETSENDPPTVVGPAARLVCPLQDWGRFIADHIRGARGNKGLLLPESYQILHSAYKDVDAMGWSRHADAQTGGYYLAFDGSNSGNYALIFVYPFRNRAVVICINQGGERAATIAHEVLTALETVR